MFHKEKLFLYILEVGKNKKRKAKQTNKQTTKKKRKQNKQLIANKQTKKHMPRLVLRIFEPFPDSVKSVISNVLWVSGTVTTQCTCFILQLFVCRMFFFSLALSHC